MSDQQTFVKVIAVGVGAMGCAILALYVKMNKMDVKINVMDVKINALLDAVLGPTSGGDTWRPTLPPTGDHRTSVASVGDHGPPAAWNKNPDIAMEAWLAKARLISPRAEQGAGSRDLTLPIHLLPIQGLNRETTILF